MRCAVCKISGFILSYWNRPLFPDLCGDSQLDDAEKFDTIIRTGGSWNGISVAFVVLLEEFGWRHVVLVSDDYQSSICSYIARPLNDMLDNDDNYTFAWLRFRSDSSHETTVLVHRYVMQRRPRPHSTTWLRFSADPTEDELDDLLEQIRARTRGTIGGAAGGAWGAQDPQ